jgi:acyl carrier protein
MITKDWDDTFEALLRRAVPLLPDGELDPTTDLRAAGLDSMGTVQLLLEIESTYEICVPDESLTRSAFATPANLWALVAGLR